jgi:hypothetical protein
MNTQVEALLVEREGYVRRGLKDRVKAVDEALEALGHKTPRVSEIVETASVAPSEENASARKTATRRRA